MIDIREAKRKDWPELVALCYETPVRRATLHPGHLKPPPTDFVEKTTARLERMLDNVAAQEAVAFVAEEAGSICGFLLASAVNAPPVYAPGGRVAFLNDLHFAQEALGPTVGRELLERARPAIKAHFNPALIVAPCAYGETERREMLRTEGFYVASEWYYRQLTGGDAVISPVHAPRDATMADAEAMADLMELKRQEYGAYAPVFWKPAPDGREKHLPFLQVQIADDNVTALVVDAPEGAGRPLDGFVVSKNGYVDDYALAQPALWPTVGADLLRAATANQQTRGAERMLVVCGAKDIPKRAMLAAEGYDLVEEWWVRDSV